MLVRAIFVYIGNNFMIMLVVFTNVNQGTIVCSKLLDTKSKYSMSGSQMFFKFYVFLVDRLKTVGCLL